MKKYEWQGVPVKIDHVNIYVKESKKSPLYWYNYEVATQQDIAGDYAIVPALRVKHPESVFYIANHFGIGIHKLINGGWPNYNHFSFHKDDIKNVFEESGDYVWNRKNFDLIGYQEYEAERRKWQKKNFPKEVEEMDALRSTIIKRKS
ncbi:hypothetical protein [Christiangramia crocea]|uniref:Uncharacterized protein n=1 Tax=Christiangramia crocea TaxID=2904124 RepID=A0A9X1UVU5_9FLAO|nr:hypothetical protein [Gramella crocea]MCG9971021.1 hypothetical protein [Gramella crocea]